MSEQPAASADHARQQLESVAAHRLRAYAAKTCASAGQFAAVLEDIAENGLPSVEDCMPWEELRETHLARLPRSRHQASCKYRPWAAMHSFVHSISRCEPSLTRLSSWPPSLANHWTRRPAAGRSTSPVSHAGHSSRWIGRPCSSSCGATPLMMRLPRQREHCGSRSENSSAMCRFDVSGWVSVTACQARVFSLLVGC